VKERPILFKAEMVRAILEGRKTQTRRAVKLPADAAGVVVDPGGTVFGPGPYLKIYRMDGCEPPMYPRSYCPYGYPGDRLWVKETWGLHAYGDETDWLRESVRGVPPEPLRAQYNVALRADWGQLQEGCFWRPGIFMPRWASRIALEITEVRVQRVQEITEDDARAEGVEPYTPPHGHISPEQRVPGPWFDRCRLGDQPHRLPFADLWDRVNGKRRRREYLHLGDPSYTLKPWRTVVDTSAAWAANPWVWAITFRRVER